MEIIPDENDSVKYNLTDDNDVENQLQNYQCATCFQRFNDKRLLTKHVIRYKDFHELCIKCNKIHRKNQQCRTSEQKNEKSYKCEDCGKSFQRCFGLKTHIRIVHRSSQKSVCSICNEEFGDVTSLNQHRKLHGPEDKIVCTACAERFDTMKDYKAHATLCSNEYSCSFCRRTFKSDLSLERHVCIWSNGQPLNCACGIIFREYHKLIEHSRGKTPYHCCSCEQTSEGLMAFLSHLRTHSLQKPFSCEICGKNFAQYNSLSYHKLRRHGNVAEVTCDEVNIDKQEEVPCPDCGRLVRWNRFEIHKRKHRRDTSLCPDCGKLLDSRKISQHMATAHSNETVTCDICKKTLKTKKILIEHLKTHLINDEGNRKPQAVCPFCGLGLAQKGSLARHILLKHERDKLVEDREPKMCKLCNAMLPNKAKYYSHLRQHRAMVERYTCSICNREFNKRQNMLRHVRLLHDPSRVVENTTHPCQLCEKVFREKKNLVRHWKLIHQFIL